ncbi:MAG: serine protease, partial [Actinomycetota bacterium]
AERASTEVDDPTPTADEDRDLAVDRGDEEPADSDDGDITADAADNEEEERRDPGAGKGSTYRRTGDPGGPVRIRTTSAADRVSRRRNDSSRKAGPSPSTDGDPTVETARPTTIDARPARRERATGRAPTKRRRVGGVAPWVPPTGRLGRRLRMREWTRRGFVPLSPGRQKLRHRILPRTVIGIAFMLMATGIGAAFSGAAFYAYYDDRLAENERTVGRFVEGFDQQFSDAASSLDEMRVDAVSTIRDELEPLSDLAADATGVVELPVTAGPSVWLVETRDADGRVAVGSAFAVAEHRGGTAMVTSLDVVRAATIEPGPPVEVLKGEQRIEAEVWSWDEDRDLALLVVDEMIPALTLAGEQAQVSAVGGRVFALGGFGGQGATAVPGVLVDRSGRGLQHTAPVGTLYAGGPLVDGGGRVLGMTSGAYQPLGVEPGPVPQAPDVAGLCAELLRCADLDAGADPEVAGS